MKKLLQATLLISLVSLMTSCCGCRGAKSKNPHFLTSDSWKLTEMAGKAVERNAEEPRSYTITFDETDKRVSGMAGCNRFFATYEEIPVRKLKLGPIGSTRMMCPDMKQETAFLQMLEKTDSYTIDGDMLMLQKAGEVIAIFQAIPLEKKTQATEE